jgi:hypothetical protein
VRWKQVALSENLETLKQIKDPDMRIVDWNTLKVIVNTDFAYK